MKIAFIGYLLGLLLLQFGLFLVTVAGESDRLPLFYSLTASGFALLLGVFYPLVHLFITVQHRKALPIISLAVCGAAVGVSMGGRVFTGFHMGSGGFPVPVISIPALIPFFLLLGFWLLGMVMLVRKFRRSKSVFERNRLKYPLLGSVIVLAGGVFNLTPLKEFPFDVVLYLFNAVLFGYAVIRYRVVALGSALRKGLRIVLFFSIILTLHFLLIKTGSSLAGESFSPELLGLVSFILIIALIVMVMKKRFRAAITGMLFQNTSHHQDLLSNFSRRLLELTDPAEIYREISAVLSGLFGSDRFVVYSRDNPRSPYRCIYSSSSRECAEAAEITRLDHPVFIDLCEKCTPVWLEEIKPQLNDNETAALETLFSPFDIPELLVPITEHGIITAIIFYGEEARGKIYVEEDFVTLHIIANLMMAALHRARLFESLEETVEEKSLLLKEVHHRVKNSLQLVSSMLQLQKDQNTSLAGLLSVTQGRINSIAHVHESIYLSDSLSRVNSRTYLESLVSDIHSQYKTEHPVRIDLRLEDIEISIQQAIPLGLALNEIITNAFKHVFSTHTRGQLTIETRQINDRIECLVGDNGPGFEIPEKPDSLGMTIVETLLRVQLEGEWRVESMSGTRHFISFPVIETSSREPEK